MLSSDRALRVAVVGSGPAGIYAADILAKSDTPVQVDVLERLPAPYGLIRYGVAPDHPRIKQIISALHRVLDRPDIRFFGNVEFGVDCKLEDLRRYYDAVIFATGADRDRSLDIPGVGLPGSFGAADFVSWYDGHPDVPRDWDLSASNVAVIGAGNVALDVARVLARPAEELLYTEIPDNVYQGLRASQVTDVHVFGRRGPAQAKFTPLELRELDHCPGVEVVVHPEDIEFDEESLRQVRTHNQTKTIVKTLQDWALREPRERGRRLHLHFLHAPVEITGEGRVEGLRTERMALTGDGTVRGTGEFHDFPVQAVYRAVGYLSTALPGLPFDESTGTVPHQAGRVLDLDGTPMPGVYVTGWIKRGPVGLIGHTKGDALETVTSLLGDLSALEPCAEPDPAAAQEWLGEQVTTWAGWQRLDAYELALGAAQDRERIKVVPREEMIDISR
ncbi:FAD-dependent oxidoreductase [Kutzneria albida]|uniref:ferredoxin--NADP(+) reductase n=1 Tax=Kutzneria albida DSM 43870 TaxID=1449976 RepID=W5WEH7_9PSEU|nr:FAD-dependent oxidoreductase [Kutzneria albida]AHH96579.1 NADPH-ferredoxin reductase fprA [Kutzneria albida DSM 43870]